MMSAQAIDKQNITRLVLKEESATAEPNFYNSTPLDFSLTGILGQEMAQPLSDMQAVLQEIESTHAFTSSNLLLFGWLSSQHASWPCKANKSPG